MFTLSASFSKIRTEKVMLMTTSNRGWGGGGGVGKWVGGGGGAYAALQTTVLHMKRLSKTESPIFVLLCVLCFQRQSFFTFIISAIERILLLD